MKFQKKHLGKWNVSDKDNKIITTNKDLNELVNKYPGHKFTLTPKGLIC